MALRSLKDSVKLRHFPVLHPVATGPHVDWLISAADGSDDVRDRSVDQRHTSAHTVTKKPS
eukprot:COSAG02_NODE_528_length_20698_cov_6.231710_11_plen_61_part_00